MNEWINPSLPYQINFLFVIAENIVCITILSSSDESDEIVEICSVTPKPAKPCLTLGDSDYETGRSSSSSTKRRRTTRLKLKRKAKPGRILYFWFISLFLYFFQLDRQPSWTEFNLWITCVKHQYVPCYCRFCEKFNYTK